MNIVKFTVASGREEVDISKYPNINKMFSAEDVKPVDHAQSVAVPMDDNTSGKFLGMESLTPKAFFATLESH